MGKFKKKSHPPLPKSRKEIRKEKRMNKKLRRSKHWKNQQISQNDLPDSKKHIKIPADKTSFKEKQSKKVDDSSMDKQLKQRQKDAKQFKKLKIQMTNQRKRQLLEANEEEDKVIRDLEKKLKLNRRKSKSLPKSFVTEGLDYLLEICNYEKFQDATNLEKELNEAGNEFEDDFALVTGSKKTEVEKKKQSKDEIRRKQDFEGGSSEAEEGSEFENDDYFDASEDNQAIESDEMSELEDDNENEDEVVLPKKKKIQEDIYGRLRDNKGNVIEETKGKYVPPHLRTPSTDEINENLLRLSKQMKGFLNRLTEGNMHSIATQMEDLYMRNSRHDVNSTLLKLLKDSLISPVLSPERIVIEHAMLISILHATVGTEIGAIILQHMVEEFMRLFRENLLVEDKRIDNIVIFLSQLYNFKIFHACLMYDILNKFVDKFEEKHIELILIVLKNIGFNLRRDDPNALKELIAYVQKRADESANLRENTRVRFMLDTLTAVKNNNMLKVQNYDPTYVDHLKKIQKSLLRAGKYVTELKISLEDLLKADTRGRWWIVGSAWSGDILSTDDGTTKVSSSQLHTFDKKILDLAKKQHMNTDIRKNIFCILMTAETYMDACEKLLKLGLKGRQCQDILHVLLHCLLKEKQYNPFYAFIVEHFCTIDKKYQLAIQFSVWDKLKEIDSLKTRQITNLAKFLSYLFLEQKLSLSVLKVLRFTEIKKKMVRLVRQIMLAVLLNDDETVILEVFSKISKSEKLSMLREGLQLFLHHFVLKNVGTITDDKYERKMQLLPKRVELVVNAMQGS